MLSPGDDLRGVDGFAHQAATRMVLCDLADGTAHVDVHDIGAHAFDDLRGIGHDEPGRQRDGRLGEVALRAARPAGDVQQHELKAEGALTVMDPEEYVVGISVGAAFQVWHTKLGRPRGFVMRHAYTGPAYDGAALFVRDAEKLYADPRRVAAYLKGRTDRLLTEVAPTASAVEALAAIGKIRSRRHHNVVVKESFGVAGSNALRLFEPEILPAQRRWMENAFAHKREIVVEPWLERLADFSAQLEMTTDGLKLCGYTGLLNDAKGQFRGNTAAPKFERRIPREVIELFRRGILRAPCFATISAASSASSSNCMVTGASATTRGSSAGWQPSRRSA